MNKEREALKLALNLIEWLRDEEGLFFHEEEDAIREALAEQQQEPFCYFYIENGEEFFAPKNAYVPTDAKPLYTSPQPAQQQQEPVAVVDLRNANYVRWLEGVAYPLEGTELYTSPPASKPWVGLTDDERWEAAEHSEDNMFSYASAIEAKLREKNAQPSKPLTDEEIDDLFRTMVKGKKSVNWLCQAIKAKLREKNHG